MIILFDSKTIKNLKSVLFPVTMRRRIEDGTIRCFVWMMMNAHRVSFASDLSAVDESIYDLPD